MGRCKGSKNDFSDDVNSLLLTIKSKISELTHELKNCSDKPEASNTDDEEQKFSQQMKNVLSSIMSPSRTDIPLEDLSSKLNIFNSANGSISLDNLNSNIAMENNSCSRNIDKCLVDIDDTIQALIDVKRL